MSTSEVKSEFEKTIVLTPFDPGEIKINEIHRNRYTAAKMHVGRVIESLCVP